MATNQNIAPLTEWMGVRRSRQREQLADVYSFLVAEARQRQSTRGDRILGLVTILGVSTGGWALIVFLLSRFLQ